MNTVEGNWVVREYVPVTSYHYDYEHEILTVRCVYGFDSEFSWQRAKRLLVKCQEGLVWYSLKERNYVVTPPKMGLNLWKALYQKVGEKIKDLEIVKKGNKSFKLLISRIMKDLDGVAEYVTKSQKGKRKKRKVSDKGLSDKKIDEFVSDKKSNGFVSDRVLSDRVMSGRVTSGRAMSDRVMSDRAMIPDRMSDKRMSDKKMSDRRESDKIDRRVSDTKVGVRVTLRLEKDLIDMVYAMQGNENLSSVLRDLIRDGIKYKQQKGL